MSWIDEMDSQLTTRLKQLRDSTTDGPSSHTTNRRQLRIATLEAQHIELTEALSIDLDRVQEKIKQLDVPSWVKLILKRNLTDEVTALRVRADQIKRELDQLRRAS